MNEIQLSVDPPSALITLNRPEVRNALSPKMVEHFHYFLDQLEKCQDVAAVIVTGEGKAFCGEPIWECSSRWRPSRWRRCNRIREN